MLAPFLAALKLDRGLAAPARLWLATTLQQAARAALRAALVGLALWSGLGPMSRSWREEPAIPQSDRQFDRTQLVADLSARGFSLGDRAHIRIFKQERQLELWLARGEGRFEKFRSYEICNYSGELGPKLAEGDRQSHDWWLGICRTFDRRLADRQAAAVAAKV